LSHDGEIDAENGRFFDMENEATPHIHVKPTTRFFDFDQIAQNWLKLSRSIVSISKLTDLVIEKGFPTFFSKDIVQAYEISKKEIDYFFRNWF